ncbi:MULTISPECIES: hypothetical protein [Caballeronia]|jgi:hypothetical protein|uniref:Uncharacterized protein n=2 Tax=Caballeronia TaxID=1827195 RepID=A0AA37I934_9BURK|nr:MULTISPECIES: hypothetical protein [Caballeronia]MBC8639564.1 hypothetical protein [Caballeronia sp. EK]GJH11319.1 hypothetical protein CBA19CS11_20795 [Caballeronia novacaledonica]GJH25626.1 hypothetical protein CBA19CS42_13940 [Caballeronia novacaledonica]
MRIDPTSPLYEPDVLIQNMNHSIDDDAFSFQAFLKGHFPTSKHVIDKARSSSYSKLLEGPVAIMAGNVPERADANSAAILGYN